MGLFGKNDKKVPRVTGFSYSSCGGMEACHYVYSATLRDGVVKLIFEEQQYYALPMSVREFEVGTEVLDAMTEIAARCKAYTWKNLKKSDMVLLDAPSLYVGISFDDGTSVGYDRMTILPEGGSGIARDMIECMKAHVKSPNTGLSVEADEINRETPYSPEIKTCEHGYLFIDLWNNTGEYERLDFSYEVTDENGALLLYEKDENPGKEPLFPHAAVPLTINLNPLGRVKPGRYFVRIMGAETGFTVLPD